MWLALATCATLVVAALTVAARWQAGSQQRLTAAWDRQVASLDEPSAAVLICSLRRHESLSIPSLARALADRRPLVASAARESIGSLVADCKTLPADTAVPRLTALAKQLADHYNHYAPAQQQFTRQLAQAMLAWPLADADFPADDLVAQCDRILTAPAPPLPAEGAPSIAAIREEDSLPPIVAPQMANRTNRPAVPPTEPTDQLRPAPEVGAPLLSPIGPDPVDPSPTEEPRAVEPRQFTRPRVPRIPPPDQL